VVVTPELVNVSETYSDDVVAALAVIGKPGIEPAYNQFFQTNLKLETQREHDLRMQPYLYSM